MISPKAKAVRSFLKKDFIFEKVEGFLSAVPFFVETLGLLIISDVLCAKLIKLFIHLFI